MRTAQEKVNIAKGCQRALLERKQNNLYIGSYVPYGYKRDKKINKLVIDKKTAPIVYTIFDLYDKGYGFTTIASYLNDRGIVPPAVYRKEGEYISIPYQTSSIWKRGSVRKIVLNKIYNGYYHYSDKKTHEEIINDDLWYRVHYSMNSKKNNGGHDFYEYNGNDLSNKIYCSYCGKNFTVETSVCKDGITKYLRCSSYDRRKEHKYHCENKLAIKYEEIKDIISLYIQNNIFSNIDLEYVRNEYKKIYKNDSLITHKTYLKMEKKNIDNLLIKIDGEKLISNNNTIYEIKKENKRKFKKQLINRKNEIDIILSDINSIGRSYMIKENELNVDKYVLDTYLDKVIVGELINKERKIDIYLK